MTMNLNELITRLREVNSELHEINLELREVNLELREVTLELREVNLRVVNKWTLSAIVVNILIQWKFFFNKKFIIG